MPPAPVSKLFRCLNHECPRDGDFTGEFQCVGVPVCPSCKLDGSLCPGAFVELALVHYLVNHEGGPIKTSLGPRMVACKPTLNKIPKHATGLAQAVSCPACKASVIWKDHTDNEVLQHVAFVEKKVKAETGKEVVNSVQE